MPDMTDWGKQEQGDPPSDERPLRWATDAPGVGERLSASDAEPPFGPPPDEAEPPPPRDFGPGSFEGEPPLPSWERIEELGALQALFMSLREILIEPARTFRRMPRGKTALGRPVIFLVVIYTACTIISAIMTMLYAAILPTQFNEQAMRTIEQFGFGSASLTPAALVMIGSVCMIILAPVIAVVKAFVVAGISHLLLMLFEGATYGFEATFRAVAYVLGATSVLLIIPFCGNYLLIIWAAVAAIIALTEVHQTSTGKTAAAVLVPVLIYCCCISLILAAPRLMNMWPL